MDLIRTGIGINGQRHGMAGGGGTGVRVLHVVPELSSGGMERAMLRLVQRSLPKAEAAGADRRIVHGICVLRDVDEELAVECPAEVPMWVLRAASGGASGMWRCWRGLRRVVREFAADVVHARSTGTWFDAAAATFGLARTRLLLSFHGRTDLEPPPLRRRLVNAWAAGRADAVLAVSQEAARTLEMQWSLPAHKLCTIPNGVDPARFYPPESDGEVREIRLRFGLQMRSRIVVCVANLVPIKAIEVLLQAWRPVCMAEPAAQLLLVGDGPLRGRLEQLAGELRCGNTVHFLGSREDVADILRASDAFVLPSRYEGCSNATLEAMATGLPIVASDVGGMRELIEPGCTGWLVPPEAPGRLGRALLDVLLDPSARERIGCAAREAAIKSFGIDTWVARHAALYRRLARGATPVSIGEEAACAG